MMPTSDDQPLLHEADDASWRLLTGDMSTEEADELLRTLEASPKMAEALEEAAEDLLNLRSLGDDNLRAMLAGADAEGLDAAELMDCAHDPDARLQAALADETARRSSWERFRRFARRPSLGVLTTVAAAAMVLFMVGRPTPHTVQYEGGWRNGAAQTRAVTGTPGQYLVSNTAELVLHPVGEAGAEPVEVQVYVEQAGALKPVTAQTQVGRSGAVRVLIDITPELAVGTHRVVVLLGQELDAAAPELEPDGWTRYETTMEVVDRL